uniref:ead/Ea22-like family protein n=1 Tax=Escherichia coli TaxID=562 RepID=UPI0011314BF5
MSKIDYQALREAAEKAGEDKWQAKKINGDFFVIRHGSYTRQHGYTSYQPIAEIDCKPVRDFVAKANPATVLELLDGLEEAKSQLNEQREYYEGVISDGSKRIAELDAREVQLPTRYDLRYGHP